jgi:hypothetical protein
MPVASGDPRRDGPPGGGWPSAGWPGDGVPDEGNGRPGDGNGRSDDEGPGGSDLPREALPSGEVPGGAAPADDLSGDDLLIDGFGEEIPPGWRLVDGGDDVPGEDEGRPGDMAAVFGFGTGEAADEMAPGPALAVLTGKVIGTGVAGLDDDQLTGLLAAARRIGSWAAAAEADAAGELCRRREATGRFADWKYLADELAAALTTSVRAGEPLAGFCSGLLALPATLAALRAGRIDRVRAGVIVDELCCLDPARAAAVEQLIIGAAARQTAGQLRHRVRRAVLAADPAAAERRRRERQRQARVELYDEQSGTAGLAGRDLPTAAALAADASIDATARALKAAGSPATLTQLRAAVFLSRLSGQHVTVMLEAILGPHDPTGPDAPASANPASAKPASPATAGSGSAPSPANPATAAPGSGDPGSSGSAGPSAPGQDTATPATANPAGPAAPGQDSATPATANSAGPGAADPAPAGPAGAGQPDGLAMRGSVHLTVPLTTWLGLSEAPGEVAGYGPTSGPVSRDLATLIAAGGKSRWCVTLTDADGRAVAHGCARRPPPSDEADRTRWLGTVRITPIESGTCTHARQVTGYRIPDSLHHIVKTRQRTCSFPGCQRVARRCDDDHTVPHDQGGRSCECNLAPLCRRHHQAKQSQSWRLDQPAPGILVWQLPHGRRYTVFPGQYPLATE